MAPLPLSNAQLKYVVAGLAQKLDSVPIDYAIMGDAAVCLLAPNPARRTADIDLVVRDDKGRVTSDTLTKELLTRFPQDFDKVDQFGIGHIIPGYKLPVSKPGGSTEFHLVEVEVFDKESWPQRPQYDLRNASRRTITVNGQAVKLFSPEWILREKIVSAHERQVRAEDILDVTNMLPHVTRGKAELNFDSNGDQTARDSLAELLKIRPDLKEPLRRVIICRALFNN